MAVSNCIVPSTPRFVIQRLNNALETKVGPNFRRLPTNYFMCVASSPQTPAQATVMTISNWDRGFLLVKIRVSALSNHRQPRIVHPADAIVT
jgi:hypothetical protein